MAGDPRRTARAAAASKSKSKHREKKKSRVSKKSGRGVVPLQQVQENQPLGYLTLEQGTSPSSIRLLLSAPILVVDLLCPVLLPL